MKRYFYTDPLKAAIMAQDFGVEFETEHGERMEYHPSVMGWNSESAPIGEQFSRFYVRAGSLPMFRMQSDDVVQTEQGGIEKIYIRPEDKMIFRWGTNVNLCFHLKQVIQRDNKHFFWPESGDE